MKTDESPLAWLHRRGLIEPEAHQAGERLRMDWTLSHLEARITMDWAGAMTPASGYSQPRDGLTTHERAIAARQRLAKALDAVGPELSGMLLEVCCLTRGLEAAERALGLPQPGQYQLGLNLDLLQAHPYQAVPPGIETLLNR